MALATMPGSLVERVGHAYWNGLRKVSAPDGLPAHVRDEFTELISRLETLYPASYSRDVDPKEAARIAKRILRLYDRMGTGWAGAERKRD